MRDLVKTAVRNIALATLVTALAACPDMCSTFCHTADYPHGEMPDVEMVVGETVGIEVWKHFAIPGCEDDYDYRAEYLANSADSAAVGVSTTDSLLVIVGLDVAQWVRVAVWATRDHDGNEYPTEDVGRSHVFFVSVRPRPDGR